MANQWKPIDLTDLSEMESHEDVLTWWPGIGPDGTGVVRRQNPASMSGALFEATHWMPVPKGPHEESMRQVEPSSDIKLICERLLGEELRVCRHVEGQVKCGRLTHGEADRFYVTLIDHVADLLGVPPDNTVESNVCEIADQSGDWPSWGCSRDYVYNRWGDVCDGEISVREFVEWLTDVDRGKFHTMNIGGCKPFVIEVPPQFVTNDGGYTPDGVAFIDSCRRDVSDYLRTWPHDGLEVVDDTARHPPYATEQPICDTARLN